jgi:peptidoglycan hydrolase-like protein with peptidoglycan-binding domain
MPPTAAPPQSTNPPQALPSQPPPAATQSSAPFIPPWPVLQQGRDGVNVTALQYQLRHHGQDITADGLFGPVTRQAVMNFQSQKGLVVDGIVGAQTWPALVQGLVLRNGSRGDAVRAAQQLLYEKFGYLDVVVDGLFGPVTEAAVRDYQLQYALTIDGLVGAQETWPSLISDAP